MTKKKENTLTVKQSNKLGFKLTDVKTGLQTLRNYANTLLLAKHAGADNGLLRYQPPVEDTRKVYYRVSDILAFLGVYN